jgi:hypothetical protein
VGTNFERFLMMTYVFKEGIRVVLYYLRCPGLRPARIDPSTKDAGALVIEMKGRTRW